MSVWKLEHAVPIIREDSKHCIFQPSRLNSQNHWGGKGPWEMIQLNLLLLTEGSSKAGCSGSRPVRLWMFLRMDSPQPVWADCPSLQPPPWWKVFSYTFYHCIWICAHCLLSFHSTLLRGVCVLYHSHQVFMHTGKIPLSLLFFRMNRPNSHSFSWHAPSSKLITSVAPSLALLCYIHLLNREFITGHNILQTCLIRAE